MPKFCCILLARNTSLYREGSPRYIVKVFEIDYRLIFFDTPQFASLTRLLYYILRIGLGDDVFIVCAHACVQYNNTMISVSAHNDKLYLPTQTMK